MSTSVRAHAPGQRGSILVEACIAIAVVFLLAIPFASLIEFVSRSAQDLVAVHATARTLALGKTVRLPGGDHRCRLTIDGPDRPCSAPSRGMYVVVTKETEVTLAFGISLRTGAKAIALVE